MSWYFVFIGLEKESSPSLSLISAQASCLPVVVTLWLPWTSMQHEAQTRPLNALVLGSVLGTGLGLDFSFFLAQFPAGCLWRMGMAP